MKTGILTFSFFLFRNSKPHYMKEEHMYILKKQKNEVKLI